jgi:hypothetical protein
MAMVVPESRRAASPMAWMSTSHSATARAMALTSLQANSSDIVRVVTGSSTDLGGMEQRSRDRHNAPAIDSVAKTSDAYLSQELGQTGVLFLLSRLRLRDIDAMPGGDHRNASSARRFATVTCTGGSNYRAAGNEKGRKTASLRCFPARCDGGAKGNRTPDLYNAIVALSQLSYGPEFSCGLGAATLRHLNGQLPCRRKRKIRMRP